MAEICTAFIVGAVAGGWVVASAKKEGPPPVPPPPPPPMSVNVRKPKRLLSMKVVDLHLEQILDPVTGEDTRGHYFGDRKQEERQTQTLVSRRTKLEVNQCDLALVTSKLKRAPKPLSMEEKRAGFAVPALFVELLKNTPQMQ